MLNLGEMADPRNLQELPVYIAPRMAGDAEAPREPEVGRAHKLARLLDYYMVDPILGLLLPGAGDVLGSVLGMYLVAIATRRKMSPIVIARMLLNLAIDGLIGIIPLLGDVFDLGYRANLRNARLLEAREHQGGKATARDWLAVIGAALLLASVIALSIYAVTRVVRAIF